MATTYGLTPQGFVKKPLSTIKSELEATITGAFGASFDVSTESPVGQVIGIFADREADSWDREEALYAAFTPDGATGNALDNICGLTGTKRAKAKFSTLTATLTGTPGASIAAATFSVSGTGAQFVMDADATIGGGGTVAATCTAKTAGPMIATAGTLTIIDTPRAGLSSVTNALDAVLGANVEVDANLRVRRETELRASGNAANEAIRSDILALEDADGNLIVTSCTVFNNDTDVTDGDGLPPHSVNVLATCTTGAGIDTAVAAALFATKAAGIQTYGSTSVTVTDSQGIAHTIKFDRPTTLLAYVTYNVTVDPAVFPADGVAQIKAAAVAYGASTLVTGKDVVSSAVAAQAFKVAGVLDSPPVALGLAPSPVSTSNLVVTLRQIALLDSSRIVVNVTNGTP